MRSLAPVRIIESALKTTFWFQKGGYFTVYELLVQNLSVSVAPEKHPILFSYASVVPHNEKVTFESLALTSPVESDKIIQCAWLYSSVTLLTLLGKSGNYILILGVTTCSETILLVFCSLVFSMCYSHADHTDHVFFTKYNLGVYDTLFRIVNLSKQAK